MKITKFTVELDDGSTHDVVVDEDSTFGFQIASADKLESITSEVWNKIILLAKFIFSSKNF